MEIGIGIHGEPGVEKKELETADEIVDTLLDKILADIDYSGSEVAVMINGCGATPLMELFIVNIMYLMFWQRKESKFTRLWLANT